MLIAENRLQSRSINTGIETHQLYWLHHTAAGELN